jgi:hypothetical protein
MAIAHRPVPAMPHHLLECDVTVDGGRRVHEPRPSTANGAAAADLTVGPLVQRLADDAARLVRLEADLAKAELREAATHVGRTAMHLGIAAILAVPAMVALTAAVIIGLGNLIGSFWTSSLVTGLFLLGVAIILARRALVHLQRGAANVRDTTEAVRDDVQWGKQEMRHMKRELTA